MENFEKIRKEEGDSLEFEHDGIECLIIRHGNLGHWCGYAKIPEGSRMSDGRKSFYTESELGLSAYEQAVNDIDVHGGVTYAGDRKGDGSMWWGFDCGHLGDISPLLGGRVYEYDTYKGKEYAIAECRKLAEQVKMITETYRKCSEAVDIAYDDQADYGIVGAEKVVNVKEVPRGWAISGNDFQL